MIADVTAAALAELRIAEGDSVWASVKATEIAVYTA
jgi:molybdate transport system ATP-binding protein